MAFGIIGSAQQIGVFLTSLAWGYFADNFYYLDKINIFKGSMIFTLIIIIVGIIATFFLNAYSYKLKNKLNDPWYFIRFLIFL